MEAQPNPDPRPALWSPKLGERGMNELHYAAYCQHVEGVKYWVDAGLDVNQKDETGYTPLAWCIDMAASERQSQFSITSLCMEQEWNLAMKGMRIFLNSHRRPMDTSPSISNEG